MQKSTKLTERVSSKFTLDFFNLLNHANLITAGSELQRTTRIEAVTQDQSAWGNT